MEIEFFCQIVGLDINDVDTYSAKNFIVLKKNEDELNTILSGDVVASLGKLHIKDLAESPYLYGIDNADSIENCHKISMNVTEHIEVLISFLWFVRDNSCNSISVTSIIDKKNVSIRYQNLFYSNAKGLYELETFTVSEWQLAMNFLDLYSKVHKGWNKAGNNHKPEDKGIIPNSLDSLGYNFMNRIERAFTFLQLARSNSLLPAKISYNALVLECLFSGNQNTEIQFRIGQRIANFASVKIEEKDENFKLVKDIYDIRSKYVHGQQMPSKYNARDKLEAVSVKVDNLLRIIFKKILSNHEPFLEKDEKLSSFLDKKMFS